MFRKFLEHIYVTRSVHNDLKTKKESFVGALGCTTRKGEITVWWETRGFGLH